MDANAFESLITPYARLTQANVDLMRQLPQPGAVLPPAFCSVRDSVAQQECAQQQAQGAPALAYAGLMFALMGNWVQFCSELGQGMFKLMLQSQEALEAQAQGTTAASRKGANGHAKPRHTPTRSAS